MNHSSAAYKLRIAGHGHRRIRRRRTLGSEVPLNRLHGHARNVGTSEPGLRTLSGCER